MGYIGGQETGVSGNDFWGFGNGKGIKKKHSRNSGTGREWKNPFPKFGNGKGMKKIHSRNSGTGREWKKSIPEIREGNQRPPFLGMTGNGNSRSPLAEIYHQRKGRVAVPSVRLRTAAPGWPACYIWWDNYRGTSITRGWYSWYCDYCSLTSSKCWHEQYLFLTGNNHICQIR